MSKRGTERSPARVDAAQPPRSIAFDREVARALSGQIAETQRLAFAQSFTHAVLSACWERLDGIPPLPNTLRFDLLPLTKGALATAQDLGSQLAEMPPLEAMHLVGTLYTTALPSAHRGEHGIFYTPPQLVERLVAMVEEGGADWLTARVLDPSCGGGAFLLAVALRMAAALEAADPIFILQQIGSRLRGFELDPFGAWLAQVGLELGLRHITRRARRPVPPVVEVRDSLDLQPEDAERFDLVIGNPPYGRITLPTERRATFARSVYGHANLYGLFTDAALRWVKRGGIVGYVTPTSMLSGLYYKALRRLLAKDAPPFAVNFVEDRQGVFVDVLQETMLAAYRRGARNRTGKVSFVASEGKRCSTVQAGTFSLPTSSDAPWLLPRVPEQVSLTRRLRALPYRLTDYGYGVSTGPLVWNRHKDQLCFERKTSCHPIIWAESVTSDGRFVWRSEKRNHAPWFSARLPKDGWLIVDRPCVLLQRTTAKEQNRRLIAAELSDSFIRRHKGVVVENHLNMVRAVVPEPVVEARVIAALLSSDIVDSAFRCINGSVAVSAFELEELPLPAPSVMAELAALIAAGATAKQVGERLIRAYAGPDAATAA